MRRQRSQRQVALALEAHFPERREELAPLLGRYFAEAGDGRGGGTSQDVPELSGTHLRAEPDLDQGAPGEVDPVVQPAAEVHDVEHHEQNAERDDRRGENVGLLPLLDELIVGVTEETHGVLLPIC